uniref:PH domain-containing protein n=1 Tax=Bicosoecida sp. CB-2014 TaxID=1486930 RepID=A0A7S1G3T0_9STRA|mmetsp:Transcript_11227/g.39077  ORF Transcript_11227/g.39077 Transcript_11227/m.39077 type:complete len:527 (+) Transcript_11227:379-1959(+)
MAAAEAKGADAERVRTCTKCGVAQVRTRFSAATCTNCLDELVTEHCGGCGKRLGRVTGGSTRHSGDEPLVAFKRSWHKRCFAVFHPDVVSGVSAPADAEGAYFAGSLLSPRSRTDSDAGFFSPPVPSRDASMSPDTPVPSYALPTGSVESPARAKRPGMRGGAETTSLTYLFYATPVPRDTMGELVEPESPFAMTVSDASEGDEFGGSTGGGRSRGRSRGSSGGVGSGRAARRTRGKRAASVMGDVTTLEAVANRIVDSGMVKTRRWRVKTYEDVVVGREVVDFLVAEGLVPSRLAAIDMGQQLISNGFLHHVHRDHDFEDAELFYKFSSGLNLRAARARDAGGSAGGAAGSAAGGAADGGAASGSATPAGGGDDAHGSVLRQASSKLLTVLSGGPAASSVEDEVSGSRRMREMRSRLHREGFLNKQGHRRKNWQRRWFVLKGYELSYYKQPQDRHPKGVVDIRNFVLQKSDTAPNSMCLVNRDKSSLTYNMRAQSDGEFVEWVRCISAVMQEWQDAAIMGGPPGQ